MQSGKIFHGLNHLRALAIIMVFCYHYSGIFGHPEWLATISKFGWTGVDLFFVLSGYLMSTQLFTEAQSGSSINLCHFYLKRGFRILPAYFVILALYFCFPLIHERESLAPAWKYITFTQNIGLDLRSMGTFSHAWSLCIEEQFYLLLPLLLTLLIKVKHFRNSWPFIALISIAGLAIRYYTYQYRVLPALEMPDGWAKWYKWIYYPTWCRLDGLLAGISIAAIFSYKPAIKTKLETHSLYLLIAGLLSLALAYYLCIDEISFLASVIGYPVIAIGYACLVVYALTPTSVLFRYTSRITTTIATLSYSIYLSHKVVIHLTQELLAKTGIAKDGNLMFLICIFTSLAAAYLLHKVIELPFLRLRERWVKE